MKVISKIAVVAALVGAVSSFAFANTAVVNQQAKKEGIEPLRIAGVRKVIAGMTTLEEVLRVVPLN